MQRVRVSKFQVSVSSRCQYENSSLPLIHPGDSIWKNVIYVKLQSLCVTTAVRPCDYKWERIILAIKTVVAIYIFNLEKYHTNCRMIEYVAHREFPTAQGESNLMLMSFIRFTEPTSARAHVGSSALGLWIPEGLLPPGGQNVFLFPEMWKSCWGKARPPWAR